jgi:hypothetical protein
MCKFCYFEKNPKVSTETIVNKLAESGLEFISSERRMVGDRTRVFVKFICTCDKDTTRIVKKL